MRRSLVSTSLCALSLLGACSIDFDRYLAGGPGADAGPVRDAGPVTPTDLGTLPADTGVTPPTDIGVTPPADTGVAPPRDTGVTPPRDTGVTPPVDVGTPPAPCRAPYLVAVVENVDANAARLLRWSFADDRRCDELPLAVPHPRAVGVAFDQTSDLSGPQLIVASEDTVAVVDPATGFVIRDAPSSGSPRSVFDIVANGSGTFAVAYTFAGGSSPGSVGHVRVFDHRGSLREVQAWQRNAQFGLSALAMTAYPGNQGQYLQVTTPDVGNGYSVFVTSPIGGGFHPRTTPALIANRNNVVSAHAYRTVDRRGHFALALGATGSTPVVYIAGAAPSASTVTDVFVPTVRCSEACPTLTRAVAFPDENDAAAGVCDLGALQYSVVRFGGASTGCRLLDTSAVAGRWRINDVAVMPR